MTERQNFVRNKTPNISTQTKNFQTREGNIRTVCSKKRSEVPEDEEMRVRMNPLFYNIESKHNTKTTVLSKTTRQDYGYNLNTKDVSVGSKDNFRTKNKRKFKLYTPKEGIDSGQSSFYINQVSLNKNTSITDLCDSFKQNLNLEIPQNFQPWVSKEKLSLEHTMDNKILSSKFNRKISAEGSKISNLAFLKKMWRAK